MKEFITDFIESFKIFHSEKISAANSNLNQNSLVSFFYQDSRIDFDRIFEKLNSFSPSFIFEKPDESLKLIAFEVVFDIKNDAEKITSFINDLKNNCIGNIEESLTKEIPLFVGGMKFVAGNNSDLWKDFDELNWFIPKFLFVKKKNFSGLLLNIFYKSIKEIDDYSDSLGKELTNLLHQDTINVRNENNFNDDINRNGKVEKIKWLGKVDTILDLIHKNEIDKVVISRKISLSLKQKPDWNVIHKKLIEDYPSCHFFLFHKKESFFFGSTPERLAKFSNGIVEIDALAGSAPRGADQIEDKLLEEQLLCSKKDMNEHNFVIEHIKNSIADSTENIKIENKYSVKKLNNIQHLHSRISAIIKNGFTPFDLLLKLYPTPAICGVSQKKAFSIINQLEDYERGMYSGVIGWFNLYNEGEFTVALRSAVTDGKKLNAFAGSGIVASSDPNTEFEETEIKLKAILNLFDEKN